MAGPVRFKNTRPETQPFEGLVELGVLSGTDEIKFRVAQQLLFEFKDSVSTGSIQVTTGSVPSNFTSIGTFTDTKRDDAVGTHPTDGASSTVNTYTFCQGTSTASDGKTFRPLRHDDDGDLKEMTDSQINTEVLDKVIKTMVDQGLYAVGQYYLSASAPSGGTWTERASISDTQVDGTTVTKKLWQKTTPTGLIGATGNGSRVLLKFDDDAVKEVTTTELKTLIGMLRNRILANNIGRYVLDTSAPSTGGTWQQMGETLTDQKKDTATYAYAGTYTGSYSGTYIGYYTGTYTGYYTGTYAADYGGFAGTSFSGDYAGNYSGEYAGSYTGSYSGDYTGNYDGVTIISTSSTQESKKLFVRIA
jgi:hypothetical protein